MLALPAHVGHVLHLVIREAAAGAYADWAYDVASEVPAALQHSATALGAGVGACLLGVAMVTVALATCRATLHRLLPAVRSRLSGPQSRGPT